MAIYDSGTASLSATGRVTGVGTTWQAQLTLVRVGATIVFKTEPVQIYTVSEIISDTEINVFNPNSETVAAGTGYAILLHDGITVQGLAQDVAETLRFYQSRESQVSIAIDVFKDFDQQAFKDTADQVEANAAEAEASKNAAKTSEDNAKTSETNAKSSENMANDSKIAAAASELAAKDAATNAEQWAQNVNADNLLTKSGNLAGLSDRDESWVNLRPTGPLRLSSDPVEDLDAATKRWVATNSNMKEQIFGLNVDVTSAGITVSPGCCYIPSEGKTLLLEQPKTINHSGLTPATKYYIYAYSNAGSLGIEVSTTENVKYGYKASCKQGDTSRRFIGMFYFTGSSEVAICKLIDGECFHSFPWGGIGRILNNGKSTNDSPVNYEKFVPLAAFTSVKLALTNTTTTLASASITPVGFDYVTNVQPYYCKFLIDLPPAIAGGGTVAYKYNAAPQDGGGFFIDVAGYKYDR